MPPETQFNMRQDDNGQWIVERIYGEDYVATYQFEDAATASDMIDRLKTFWNEEEAEVRVTPFQANPEADYAKGYRDGMAGTRNSLLIGRDAYDIGWLDGEGDRIYDAG